MTNPADPAKPFDVWPCRPMPADVHKQGPWGQLNAWDHPRLTGPLKAYVASADVWIHANGHTYYMHYGSWRATVTYPGPTCSCNDESPCIHVQLTEALRSLP